MVGWTTLRVAHAPNHRPPLRTSPTGLQPQRSEQGKTKSKDPASCSSARLQSRRHITPTKQAHPYNLPRATQHRLQTGHDPEMVGHVRRNAHSSRVALESAVQLKDAGGLAWPCH